MTGDKKRKKKPAKIAKVSKRRPAEKKRNKPSKAVAKPRPPKKVSVKASPKKKNLKSADLPTPLKKTKSEKSEKEIIAKTHHALLKDESILESGQDRRRRKRGDDAEDGENAADSDQTLDRTPMKIYLNQIEHINLLTAEQEIELATKIQSRGAHAEAARHQMIRANLRLGISIAKRYSNMGLAFSDLVEEGNIGLMRAVEKFNPERGYRFSTYASWWIKQGIMRALSNQGKTIRIPVYMYDVISRWRKVRDGLVQKLNRVPTRKEIAEIMEVPVQKVKEIENIAGRPSSLNAPVSLDGTAELIDLIQDDASHSPEVQIGEALKNERVQGLLDRLDERERRILVLRFGLGSEELHTLEAVAQEFGITRERVRQIESVALKKIKDMLHGEHDKLENYISG